MGTDTMGPFFEKFCVRSAEALTLSSLSILQLFPPEVSFLLCDASGAAYRQHRAVDHALTFPS